MAEKLYYKVLKILADGEYHSGEALGETLGVTRSAVWKGLNQIRELAIEVESITGKGYCIPGGLELLDAKAIQNNLPNAIKAQIESLDVLPSLDSTNRYLIDVAKQNTHIKPVIIFAERQTAGYGRRGRTWVSPFASHITTSILKTFTDGANGLAGLSLVLGMAIADALRAFGLQDIAVKWPNDIYWQHKKLAGVLTEIYTDGLGMSHVVMGIGLNYKIPEQYGIDIDRDWIDLAQITNGDIGRNALAAKILQCVFESLDTFQQKGFSVFRKRWPKYDLLAGKEVLVHGHPTISSGTVQELDSHGGLVLQSGGVDTALHAGEVSLRFKQ